MLDRKRLMNAIMAGALVLTGLVGCGQAQQAASNAAPEPKTSQELLERWEADPNSKNYHVDLNADITATFLGQSLAMPMKCGFDVAGDASHGNMEMDLSAMGSEKLTTELYVEKEGDAYIQYSSMENDGKTTWAKTKQDSGAITDQFTSTKLLAEAEFSKTEDGGYQLTIPASKLIEALGSSDQLSGMMGTLDEKSIKEALDKSKATYTFDKDCKLQKIAFTMDYSLDSATGDDKSDSNEQPNVSGSMKMSFELNFSNFGGIDPASVKVPDDVKKSAVDAGATTDDGAEAATEQKDAA